MTFPTSTLPASRANPLDDLELVAYLLEHELVSMSTVVLGEIRVVDASRRNRNHRVLCSDGPSFLIKQGLIRDGFSPITREAAAYQLLGRLNQADAPAQPSFGNAPSAWMYDTERDLLVLDLVVGASTLGDVNLSRSRPPRAAARLLGTALANLHDFVPTKVSLARAQELVGNGEPGVLSVQRPGLTLLRDFSSACIQLVEMVQGSAELGTALQELETQWRNEALIHHDLRFDNVLLTHTQGRAARRTRQLLLVDWETAALGDPAWDVGTVLGEYLGEWIASIPAVGTEPPDRLLHLAGRPLESVQPAMAAFWTAYSGRRALTPTAAEDLLLRSTKCAGLKLIQSALEQVQRAARPTIRSACFLQTGANILSRPEGSVAVLLALGDTP
jgi:aminoglycoside phosphotransferase (APT) family kinase protein